MSVARHLFDLRGPRFTAAPAASTRIVTAPGEECQFDWSDVSHWTREWGLGDIQCFQGILSWSRVRIWWFARSIDREYTFEGLVRFFERVGGVPKVLRTDRMGALGTSQGRRFTLHPPAAEFAQFHGTEIRACQARDAKRKGKVERPFRDVKERFLEECAATGAPESLSELNERAALWIEERIHSRVHRGMGEIPDDRFAIEGPMLVPLPRRRFDTAYVEARRVHVAIPQIEWRGVHYSVPPRCLGQKVEVRHEVDSSTIEIRWAGEVVGTHTVADPTTGEVWDAGHWQAAQQAALSRSRGRHLSVVLPDEQPRPEVPLRLDIEGDVDVEVPDLSRYETGGRVVTNSLYEQLKDDLGYLGLNRSAECFATLAEEAKEQEWSHIEFLARVVGEQASATVNRKLAARLRFARFPFRRTLDDYDFQFQPSVDRKLIDDLATLRFIEENRPILFLGQPGCGKTHLAVALATTAVEAGYRGYFTTADDMVNTLVKAKREGTMATKLKTLTAPSVLVIDDVGLLPIERGGAGVFFHVVNTRYEKGHPTLITTNRGLPEWGEIFGDPVVAAAILDRLMHNAVVFNIKGPSWRMREHHALEQATTDPDKDSGRRRR